MNFFFFFLFNNSSNNQKFLTILIKITSIRKSLKPNFRFVYFQSLKTKSDSLSAIKDTLKKKKKKRRPILSKIPSHAIKLSEITARVQPSSNRRGESERELNYQPLVESDPPRCTLLKRDYQAAVFYAPLSLFIPVSMKFQIGRVT